VPSQLKQNLHLQTGVCAMLLASFRGAIHHAAAHSIYALRGIGSSAGKQGGLFGISDLQAPSDFLMMLQGTFSRRVRRVHARPCVRAITWELAAPPGCCSLSPGALLVHAGRGSCCATSRRSSQGRRWCN
jgi:hypothetical protein